MRNSPLLKLAAGVIAGTALAACSSGSPALGPSSLIPSAAVRTSSTPLASNPLAKILPLASRRPDGARPWNRMRPTLGTYVYSCQPASNTCNIYPVSGGSPVGQLTSSSGLNGPMGTITDRKGNWFIANSSAENVLVFKPGATQPFATLEDPGAVPLAVAISKSLVAVSSFSPASVAIYDGTATDPSYALTDSRALYGMGVAIDKNGNCYWAYDGTDGYGHTDEFSACQGSGEQSSPFPGEYDASNLAGGAGGLASYNSTITAGAWETGYMVCLYCKKQPCQGWIIHCMDSGAGLINFGENYNTLYVANLSGSIQVLDMTTGKLDQLTTDGLSESNPPVGVAFSQGLSQSPEK